MNIRACIFDLDGTLIDSEPLKTDAHITAVLAMARNPPSVLEIEAAVTNLIGVPTPETAIELVRRFDLEEEAGVRQRELGLSAPWEAYSHLHLDLYQRILDQPGTLARAQLPSAVDLLRRVRREGYLTALGSMSYRNEVQRTLDILDWHGLFDLVLAGDEVSRGKPDPEIYRRIAQALQMMPGQCLVLEDSPAGIGAALAAGMHCLAVPNDLTRDAVLSMPGLDRRWIVQDSDCLLGAAERVLRSGQPLATAGTM